MCKSPNGFEMLSNKTIQQTVRLSVGELNTEQAVFAVRLWRQFPECVLCDNKPSQASTGDINQTAHELKTIREQEPGPFVRVLRMGSTASYPVCRRQQPSCPQRRVATRSSRSISPLSQTGRYPGCLRIGSAAPSPLCDSPKRLRATSKTRGTSPIAR